MRRGTEDFVVCEPRQETWFTSAAETLLRRYRIGRVGADPAPAPGAFDGAFDSAVYSFELLLDVTS